MTPEERERLLAAATPRPWTVSHHVMAVIMGDRGEVYVAEIDCSHESDAAAAQAHADADLIVTAVNEHEAHLDGERLLRGVLDYFRGYDDEREDGRTSPVIPKIEDVLARLDAARNA